MHEVAETSVREMIWGNLRQAMSTDEMLDNRSIFRLKSSLFATPG